jgi:hypothetical protein
MAEPDILDVQVTETDVVNTVTETNIFAYTVPANTLGTNKALRVQIKCDYLNNTAGTANVRLRIYYGATELWEDLGPTTTQDAARRPILIEFILFPRNASNSQSVGGIIKIGTAGAATTGIGNLGDDEIFANCPFRGIASATEDSTTELILKVTVVHSVADANISIRKLYSSVEVLAA